MFDVAFSELLVIGIVALIVIGPERLPKVARTAGTWLGRLNRYVAQVKQDIDRDMQLEELRKLQQQMKDTAQKYEIIAAETGQELKREAEQVDRVMQAMAVTDGGLALQEYEKIKVEQASQDDATANTAVPKPTEQPLAKAPVVPDDVGSTTAGRASSTASPFRTSLDEEIVADDLRTAQNVVVKEQAVPQP
jgi:sec-independent protein translocase protein TatB